MKSNLLVGAIIVMTLATSSYAQDTSVVKVAKVTFNEAQPEKAFLRPIPIRVNASTTRGVTGVQVRLFPGRTLRNVKELKLGVTTTGCFILKSRVDSYSPTIRTPDVWIQNIDSTDFRCSADGLPQPTPFVIVVESADVGDAPLFRIHPSQMGAYFAHAGEFILTPPPELRCASTVKRPATAKPKKRSTAAEVPVSAMVDVEVTNHHCIEVVQ